MIEVIENGYWIDVSSNIFKHRRNIRGSIWVYLIMKIHPEYNDLMIANELDMKMESVVTAITRLRDMGYVKYDKKFHCRIPRSRIGSNSIYEKIKSGNAKCAYCGSIENLEVDHIIPVSKGGGNTLDNLQILCRSCNLNKGSKLELDND